VQTPAEVVGPADAGAGVMISGVGCTTGGAVMTTGVALMTCGVGCTTGGWVAVALLHAATSARMAGMATKPRLLNGC